MRSIYLRGEVRAAGIDVKKKHGGGGGRGGRRGSIAFTAHGESHPLCSFFGLFPLQTAAVENTPVISSILFPFRRSRPAFPLRVSRAQDLSSDEWNEAEVTACDFGDEVTQGAVAFSWITCSGQVSCRSGDR